MIYCNENESLQLIVKSLQRDEVILSSSDTVLGLFAQLSETSKKKLDFIKQRNLKPYIVLLSSVKLLDAFIDQELDADMQKIIATYWPGPLTIIFKAKASLPNWIKSEQGTIAIRIPDHKGLQEILQHVDGLFTTSANISDQPLPQSFSDINPLILDQVAIVSCDKHKIYDGPASTILDFVSSKVRIVRQGTIVIDSI